MLMPNVFTFLPQEFASFFHQMAQNDNYIFQTMCFFYVTHILGIYLLTSTLSLLL